MEALAYSLVNYSFLALSVGERLLFLSFAGWILVWIVASAFRQWGRGQAVATAPLWMMYLLWLIPAASPFFPSVPQAWLIHSWFSVAALTNPCAISPVQRLGHSVFSTSTFFTATNLLVLGWCLVSGFLCYRFIRQRLFFKGIVRSAKPLQNIAAQKMLAQLRADFAISRPLSLCSSSAYPAPFTMGVWQPVIFIPVALVKNLSTAELHAVIAHECAHVARRDDIAVCCQQLTGAIFFFNPFLRYANRQLAEVREICCDALAIRLCRLEPRAYGQTLLRVIEQLGASVCTHERIAVSALLAQDLQWRLRCLVAPATKPYRWRPMLVLLACLLCVSIFLGGTGKPLPPVIEGDAVKTLVKIAYVMPLANARIGSGVHLTQPLGCHLPARDHFHAGIDFFPTLTTAAPVRAFADGVVESISQPPGNIGWMVRIAHAQGLQSTYVRLDQVNVAVGAPVRIGQVFASMGRRAQTDHVHFELTHRGRILDPAILFAD